MKRILVIEDDAAVRNLIVETLRSRQEWQPLAAENGAEGIATALREKPDLILCDIQMPRKNGYEVLRELRQTPEAAMIPFMFLTGQGDKPGMRQAMELGADDYLVKPFTIKELLAAVDARFEKQALLARSTEQRLEELRGSLSFALPHELVTPLNSILGYSSLILETTDSPDTREYATLIRAAGERLRTLVEKFLLYAQLEIAAAAPKSAAAISGAEPGETADVVIAAAERAAQESRRPDDLQLEVTSASHRIENAHLARLVRELLENSFKFSEPGSKIVFASGPFDGGLSLQAIDSGSGFTPEQIGRIGAHLQFNRRLQEQQGTGLGLAICRRIAELYGGTLEIESTQGRTCVHIRLPA